MNYLDKIKESIKVLYQRTGIPFEKGMGTVMLEAIQERFPNLRHEHIDAAIRKGSTGEYGKIYNRLTAQEVCIWIREYMKTAPYLDVDDMWYREKGCTVEEYSNRVNKERLEFYTEKVGLDKDEALEYMEKNGYFCSPDRIREAQQERLNNIKNR